MPVPRYLALGAVAVLLTGCRSDPPGPPLTAVAGKAMLDGHPLDGATIRFIPYGDTLGHGGNSTTASDGSFEIIANRQNNRKGLLPGTYKVTFSRFLMPDGSPLPPGVPQQGSDARQTIPEIYTQRDSTPFDVTIESEPKTLEFALKKS